jgi:hypothetical protein
MGDSAPGHQNCDILRFSTRVRDGRLSLAIASELSKVDRPRWVTQTTDVLAPKRSLNLVWCAARQSPRHIQCFPGLKAGLIIHIEGFAGIRDGLVSKGRVGWIVAHDRTKAKELKLVAWSARRKLSGPLEQSHEVAVCNLRPDLSGRRAPSGRKVRESALPDRLLSPAPDASCGANWRHTQGYC